MGNADRVNETKSSGDVARVGDAEHAGRRVYTAPTLRHLGSVRELTLGRSGTRNDLGGQQGRRRSTREVKTDIAYLDEAQRRTLADQVLGLKLASYEYRAGVGEPTGRHLGFIIEDAPSAAFVNAGGKTVDVYAFASAIAAVVQEQAKTIERLEREVSTLRAQAGEGAKAKG